MMITNYNRCYFNFSVLHSSTSWFETGKLSETPRTTQHQLWYQGSLSIPVCTSLVKAVTAEPIGNCCSWTLFEIHDFKLLLRSAIRCGLLQLRKAKEILRCSRTQEEARVESGFKLNLLLRWASLGPTCKKASNAWTKQLELTVFWCRLSRCKHFIETCALGTDCARRMFVKAADWGVRHGSVNIHAANFISVWPFQKHYNVNFK